MSDFEKSEEIERSVLRTCLSHLGEPVEQLLTLCLNALPGSLRVEFSRRPIAYIVDAVLQGTLHERCYLLRENYNPALAMGQLQRAGYFGSESTRLALSPVDGSDLGRKETAEVTVAVWAVMTVSILQQQMASKRGIAQVKPSGDTGAYLSVSKTAKLLHIGRSTVVAMIESGRLKAVSAAKPGAKRKSWRIERASIAQLQLDPAKAQKTSVRRSQAKRFV